MKCGLIIYMGKGRIRKPLHNTSYYIRRCRFVFGFPLVLCLIAITFPMMEISFYGVVLAILSGAFTSALGYTIWYVALGGLSEIEAAVVQLSVPVIAAIGGVIFVSESISFRLVIACLLVLGGIFTVLISRWKFALKRM